MGTDNTRCENPEKRRELAIWGTHTWRAQQALIQKMTGCDTTTTRTDLDGEIVNTSIPLQYLTGVVGSTWKLQ